MDMVVTGDNMLAVRDGYMPWKANMIAREGHICRMRLRLENDLIAVRGEYGCSGGDLLS